MTSLQASYAFFLSLVHIAFTEGKSKRIKVSFAAFVSKEIILLEIKDDSFVIVYSQYLLTYLRVYGPGETEAWQQGSYEEQEFLSSEAIFRFKLNRIGLTPTDDLDVAVEAVVEVL